MKRITMFALLFIFVFTLSSCSNDTPEDIDDLEDVIDYKETQNEFSIRLNQFSLMYDSIKIAAITSQTVYKSHIDNRLYEQETHINTINIDENLMYTLYYDYNESSLPESSVYGGYESTTVFGIEGTDFVEYMIDEDETFYSIIGTDITSDIFRQEINFLYNYSIYDFGSEYYEVLEFFDYEGSTITKIDENTYEGEVPIFYLYNVRTYDDLFFIAGSPEGTISSSLEVVKYTVIFSDDNKSFYLAIGMDNIPSSIIGSYSTFQHILNMSIVESIEQYVIDDE